MCSNCPAGCCPRCYEDEEFPGTLHESWLDSRGECIDPDLHLCVDCYQRDLDRLREKAAAANAAAAESAKHILALTEARADNEALRNVSIQTQRDLDNTLLEVASLRSDNTMLGELAEKQRGLIATLQAQQREAVPA